MARVSGNIRISTYFDMIVVGSKGIAFLIISGS